MGAGRAGRVAGLVALACGLALPSGSASAAQLQLFPGVNGVPVAAGPDGTVALRGETADGNMSVTTLAPDGSTHTLSPDAPSSYVAITFGPDGNYWIGRSSGSVDGQAAVTRISPAGTDPATFSVPSPMILSMTSGTDGNVWFHDATGRAGRISHSGDVTMFDTPPGWPISTGPDGNLWWFSQKRDGTPSTIVRMTTAGVVSEFPVPASAEGASSEDVSQPVVGAGEFLWVGTSAGLLRTSLAGVVTKRGLYADVFAGDADHLWAASGSSIVQMDPTTGAWEHAFSVRPGLNGSSFEVKEAVRATDGTIWAFAPDDGGGVLTRVIPTLDPPTLRSWTPSASVPQIGVVLLGGKATIDPHGEESRAVLRFGKTKKYTGEVYLVPAGCQSCDIDNSGYGPLKLQVEHSPYPAGYCSAKGIIHMRLEVTNASGRVTSPDVVKHIKRCLPSFKCHVPNLRGKTLARARGSLRAAGCRLGRVKGPRHHSKVVAQSPRAGVTRPANTRVRVRLAA